MKDLNQTPTRATRARQRTSARLRGLDLPEAFRDATLAAGLLESGCPNDRRRRVDHALTVAERGGL